TYPRTSRYDNVFGLFHEHEALVVVLERDGVAAAVATDLGFRVPAQALLGEGGLVVAGVAVDVLGGGKEAPRPVYAVIPADVVDHMVAVRARRIDLDDDRAGVSGGDGEGVGGAFAAG